MKAPIRNFLSVNGLKQIELSKYLGLSESFLSQIVNGSRQLPPDKLKILLNNDKGWDVSMFLTQHDQSQHVSDTTNPEIIRLIKIIEEQNHTIALLAEQIAKTQ